MNPVKTLSYSKYALLQQCGLKFKFIYIDKLKEAESEVLANGNAIHKDLETYLRIKGMPFPECGKSLKEDIEKLKENGAVPEQFWTCDSKFKPTVSNWAPSTAILGKVDAFYVKDDKLHIIDFKTGKVRPNNMEQLELYAVMGFNRFPVEEIEVELFYVDHGIILKEAFERTGLNLMQLKWEARLKDFSETTEFNPNPSALCGWCDFSMKKQGICKVG